MTYILLAISYGFYGVRLVCQLLKTNEVTFVDIPNDILYIGWVFSLWLGVSAYGGAKTSHLALYIVPAVLIIWNLAARGIGLPTFWRLLPQHSTGAILFGMAGFHLWCAFRVQKNWGLIALSVLLWLHGLSTLSYPFTYKTWYAPYGFTIYAILSPAIGMGLMLTALIERQYELLREMKFRSLAEEELKKNRDNLENVVKERTSQLEIAKEQAESLIGQRVLFWLI